MTVAPPEFHHLIATRDLPAASTRPIVIEADAEECASIARALDLIAVDSLGFRGEIVSSGAADWRLSGEVTARITQSCVVTLVPVKATIAAPIDRRYTGDGRRVADEIDFGPESDDPPEPLGDGVDVGAAALEALVLAIDPYPRAPGVAFAPRIATPPGVEELTDEAIRPFASLAALKKSMDSRD